MANDFLTNMHQAKISIKYGKLRSGFGKNIFTEQSGGDSTDMKTILGGGGLRLCIALGLAVRLILIPFTSSPFDVGAGWTAVIEEIYAGNSLYDAGLYKYTPIWGYILSIIAYSANCLDMGSFGEMFTTIYPTNELTFGYGFISNPGFNVLLKIPALIFDVLTAFALYRLVLDITGDRRKSEISFALWFLCPVVIMSSAILCMFDSIMVFFMVESIIFLGRKNMLLAGMLITLSALTKAFSALLLPLMVVYVLSGRENPVGVRMRNLGMAVLGGLMIFLAVYAMPILSGEFSDSLWFLTSRSDTYASSGFSTSAVVFSNIFFYMPAIIVIAVLACAVMYLSKGDREKTFLITSTVMMSMIFCFPFVAYTPTYGVTLLLPIIIMYILNGRVALIPWALTMLFVLHGMTIYWETMFYPLAAFTDLLDISDIAEKFGNPAVHHSIVLTMSSAGFVIMMIVLVYHVLPLVKRYITRREGSDVDRYP